MEYKKCNLYGLKSKKKLIEILFKDTNKDFYKQAYFVDKISPFLLEGTRIVEAPTKKLKKAQRRVLKFLQKIDVPENIFSGIKKRSFIDNAKLHIGNNFLFKLDISKFFPSTHRDKVYKFYLNKLNMSPDVAQILTNLSTINFDRLPESNNKSMVGEYINKKNIKCLNHLITGSPLSPILSYFANIDMFNELFKYCKDKDFTISVYVDDIVISSKEKIIANDRKFIYNTIKKYGYKISKEKSHWYNKEQWKKITGLIITEQGLLKAPKNIELQVKSLFKEFRAMNYEHIDNLLGYLVLLSMIDEHYYSMYKMVKSKRNKLKGQQ